MRKIHRWLGVPAAIFLLLASFTGVWLECVRFFGAEETERERIRDLTSTVTAQSVGAEFGASFDKARAAAAARAGAQPLDKMVWQLKGDAPTITFFFGPQGQQAGRRIAVHARTGEVLGVEDYVEDSFILRLHSGEAFGDGGMVLGMFWGLSLFVLTITGIVIYFRMKPRTPRTGIRKVFWSFALVVSVANLAHAQGGSSKPSATTQPAASESATQPEAAPAPSAPAQNSFTGSYQATFNASVLGNPKPSLGHRLNLSYAPPFGGSFDTRLEYYIDGSYNSDPPGELRHNINEPKFEGQLMYNRPLIAGFGLSAGLLYHRNYKFPDEYGWAIAGLTYTLPIGKSLTLSAAALGEKKLDGVRPFYDLSSTLEYRFASSWNVQLSYHRYENVGQFDPEPTQKQEYEAGLNFAVTKRQTIGISFFRHIQFDAPNDQFSYVKMKYSISF